MAHPRFGYCVYGVIAILGSITMVSACSKVPTPGPSPLDSATKPIRVSVNPGDVEQRVLGRLYTQALAHSGRRSILVIANKPANRSDDIPEAKAQRPRTMHPARSHSRPMMPSTPTDRIARLNQLQGDLVVGCTGELYSLLDPQGAAALSKQYLEKTSGVASGAEKNSGTWREKTYRAMVKSLPGNMMASDPSSAVGCHDVDQPQLPQNIVAIFRKPMLDRADRLVLNKVGGTVTTTDLKKLVKSSQASSASLIASVDAYMQAHDL